MKPLTSPQSLEQVLAESESSPVLVFKHSTACPVSAAAHQEVAAYENAAPGALPVFLVRVIEERPVSNLIAGTLNVAHASPQIILVRHRAAVWNASHMGITASAIQKAAQGI